MDEFTKVRAWWAHKQGLLSTNPLLSPSDVFHKTGWCRSVAGCNPYLSAFSRAGLGREIVDEAARNLEISELPAARGCTYIVSKEDFALALACGGRSSGSPDMRLALTLGATVEELDSLKEKVLLSLQEGQKDPQQLKRDLGSAVRSFGEAGKKKGLATSLPLVLGALQSEGNIVRRPISGRLDEQRYAYQLWPLPRPNLEELTQEGALQALAGHFFRWIGPASLNEFCVLAGVSQKSGKAATAPLNLVSVEGSPDSLLLPSELKAFEAFHAPEEPCYRLVNCMDSSILLHTDYTPLFTAEGRERFGELQGKQASGGVVKELRFNAIIDRGTIVGLWEFDPVMGQIVYVSFVGAPSALVQEIDKTETYIREQLGDARTFSLDSPKSRLPKIERLRAA